MRVPSWRGSWDGSRARSSRLRRAVARRFPDPAGYQPERGRSVDLRGRARRGRRPHRGRRDVGRNGPISFSPCGSPTRRRRRRDVASGGCWRSGSPGQASAISWTMCPSAPSVPDGDMASLERGLGWSPWLVVVLLGVPTLAATIWFFGWVVLAAVTWRFPRFRTSRYGVAAGPSPAWADAAHRPWQRRSR